MHVLQCLSHAQTRWMQGAALIVIQDAAYRGTIIQFHCLGGVVGWDRVGLGSSNSRRATKPSNHTDLPVGFS